MLGTESRFPEPCLQGGRDEGVRKGIYAPQCLQEPSKRGPTSPSPGRSPLPAGTEDRGLAEETLQRFLALAPSMSWNQGLRARESGVGQEPPPACITPQGSKGLGKGPRQG